MRMLELVLSIRLYVALSRLKPGLLIRFHPLLRSIKHDPSYLTVNPKPFMQSRYLSTVLLQSSCGSSDLLNSMQSSLEAFSSLQTQHGFTFSVVVGFRSAARLFGGAGLVAVKC